MNSKTVHEDWPTHWNISNHSTALRMGVKIYWLKDCLVTIQIWPQILKCLIRKSHSQTKLYSTQNGKITWESVDQYDAINSDESSFRLFEILEDQVSRISMTKTLSLWSQRFRFLSFEKPIQMWKTSFHLIWCQSHQNHQTKWARHP
jgi:hypothetical protein